MKENVSILAIGANNLTEHGSAVIVKWSSKERFLRGAKTLFGCWAGAILCVFIPVLHFILVPTLFFGGLIGAFIVYRKQEILESGELQCPVCHHPLKLSNLATAWPLRMKCSNCQASFYIQDASLPPLISISAHEDSKP